MSTEYCKFAVLFLFEHVFFFYLYFCFFFLLVQLNVRTICELISYLLWFVFRPFVDRLTKIYISKLGRRFFKHLETDLAVFSHALRIIIVYGEIHLISCVCDKIRLILFVKCRRHRRCRSHRTKNHSTDRLLCIQFWLKISLFRQFEWSFARFERIPFERCCELLGRQARQWADTKQCCVHVYKSDATIKN